MAKAVRMTRSTGKIPGVKMGLQQQKQLAVLVLLRALFIQVVAHRMVHRRILHGTLARPWTGQQHPHDSASIPQIDLH
jgi:hypothetical protein